MRTWSILAAERRSLTPEGMSYSLGVCLCAPSAFSAILRYLFSSSIEGPDWRAHSETSRKPRPAFM
jgi:hypothetical protein